jgi:hypothetical protein
MHNIPTRLSPEGGDQTPAPFDPRWAQVIATRFQGDKSRLPYTAYQEFPDRSPCQQAIFGVRVWARQGNIVENS